MKDVLSERILWKKSVIEEDTSLSVLEVFLQYAPYMLNILGYQLCVAEILIYTLQFFIVYSFPLFEKPLFCKMIKFYVHLQSVSHDVAVRIKFCVLVNFILFT